MPQPPTPPVEGDQDDLRVVRLSPRHGLLLWRGANYAVQQVGPDGFVEVLTGWFRNHRAATDAARRRLRSG